ncbi:hypothetical protein F0562_001886 [Nyssa sinensis]|uniref:Uncharacterized protein n=1 Tax=Nyssa sinensis TaxID=561372 RepID=A0A5J5C8A4_9ASTE|nr:hypothetical protein F0562_001886 [Nyssa sinensis]
MDHNVLCLLRDPEGTPLGVPIYPPQNAGPKELQQMVNKLLNNACQGRRIPFVAILKYWNSFSSRDNTILKYWNFLQADKSKLRIGNKVPMAWATISITEKDSLWFSKQADIVKKVVSTMPVHFQFNYKESRPSEKGLAICGSEVFYIPRRFVGDFADLVDLVGNLEIHHRIAVPMFFMAMDSPQISTPCLT